MTSQRIPVTRHNPDGTTTDGTAELLGPAVLRDLRTLAGDTLALDDGSLVDFDLDQVLTLGEGDTQ